MKTSGKVVAWIYISTTLFAGCYSSTLTDPTGNRKDRIHSGDIEYVVTKDSTRYEFDELPAIVNDTIVGAVKHELNGKLQVSIPVVHVAIARKSLAGDIASIVTNDSSKYTFERPPAITGNAIVGEAILTASGVSIPLTDVSRISVSEFDALRTALAVVGVAGLIAGGIIIAYSASFKMGGILNGGR